MANLHRPQWQLPAGVSRGLWDYVQSPAVADDYDDYFAFNSLFEHKDLEIGDKWFPYRGVPNMFLHVFRRRELTSDLGDDGFQIVEMIPLDVARRHRLRWPWLGGALRTNEWIVVCA
ncbi:MAG: hypothetical protein ACR2NM_07130 [Bythopirellula sp.]